MFVEMFLCVVGGALFGFAICAVMSAASREDERHCMETELEKHIKRADDLACSLNYERLKREVEVRCLKEQLKQAKKSEE